MTAPPRPLAYASAVILALLCFESILTIWIHSLWPTAIFEVGVLALAAAWLFLRAVRPYRLLATRALIPLAAVVLLGVIQLLTRLTISNWDTVNALLRWLTYIAAFWICLQFSARPAIRIAFLRALLGFTFLFAVVSLIQWFAGGEQILGIFTPESSGPYLGTFTNRDHYAAWIELILPLALFEALSDVKRLWLAAAISGMLFASVIAGASRAGSFLVVVEIVVVLALARRRLPAIRSAARGLSAVLLVIAACTVAVGWSFLSQRLEQRDPYKERAQILASSFAMIRAHPLAGFGLGNFENAYPPYAIADNGEILSHAHNDWVEWAVEGGLPLTLILLAMTLLSAPAIWRSLWGLGILSCLIHSLIDFPMQRPPVALWLFVLLGAVFARDQDHNPGVNRR